MVGFKLLKFLLVVAFKEYNASSWSANLVPITQYGFRIGSLAGMVLI